jgi:GTPase SAR1 family protein
LSNNNVKFQATLSKNLRSIFLELSYEGNEFEVRFFLSDISKIEQDYSAGNANLRFLIRPAVMGKINETIQDFGKEFKHTQYSLFEKYKTI